MKTLGLIGGTSWYSTIEYYRFINELAAEKMGTQGNPPMIIYSLNIELMREQNWDKINDAYLNIVKKLTCAGAEAIVICANTPHQVYNYVQPRIKIPILHIADAVGEEAKKHNLTKLGLLGNRPTMTKGFIQERLTKKFNIETIIPNEEFLDTSHKYVSKELTQGKFTEEAKAFYLDQIKQLQDRGAEGVILGCTELPLLIDQKDIDIPLLATTNLHAQMAVDFLFS